MKAVLISFLIFVASMFLVLPSFNIGTQFISMELLKYLPFVVMALAMFCQWNALLDYKSNLDLKKLAYDATQNEDILKNEIANEKEKRTLYENELKKISSEKDFIYNEKTKALSELATLKKSLDKAYSNLSQTELRLQESLEKLNTLQNQSSHSDVLTFLSLLQEKGRLLDFLMDDISIYTDAQVGAAGRVVHQGCSSVLKDFFNIAPLRSENEETLITLQKNEPMSVYRMLGKHTEDLPVDAKIIHRGWGTELMNIPRRSTAPVEFNGKMVISPVELEIPG